MIRAVSLALFGVSLATLLSACSQETEAPPEPPVRPVLSLVVEPRTASAAGYVGTVEPRYSADLGFRILGRLVTREADVGDQVGAGEVLASLDPSVLTLNVRAFEAELSNAEAQLGNASATEERQAALVERNAGTRAEFERAQEAREAAAAAAVRAKSNLDKAREQLSYTRLVSDTEGIVTATAAEIGQTVTAGQTVVTVARAEIREAVVDIPDEIARDIREGDRFDVALQIDPTQAASGTVREVAPQSDAATRSRRVKITLAAPPAPFRLGTTVNAVPRVAETSFIEIPSSAILSADGREFVWVVDEAAGTVARRAIETAGQTGSGRRIAGGIEPGTRIVTAGINSLTDGQKIRINQDIVP